MRDYGPDLFAGTAGYYVKYRAKYPPRLFKDIAEYFGLDGRGRLLDLGCGTGELAIPLAKYFEQVLALDPEPQMLERARRKPQPDNIEWKFGSSEDLTEVGGPFKLITLGQSFHWMDGQKVINQLYGLAERGGGVCLVGGGSREQPAQNSLTAVKDETVKRLIEKYLGPKRRAGRGFYEPSGQSWEGDLLPNSKFGGFEKRIYQTKVVRSAEQELGNLYSMSWARRDFFGSKIGQFEAEFRQALGRIAPAGKFANKVYFEAYFLRKNV